MSLEAEKNFSKLSTWNKLLSFVPSSSVLLFLVVRPGAPFVASDRSSWPKNHAISPHSGNSIALGRSAGGCQGELTVELVKPIANSNGLQPTSDGLQPAIAMASIAMASSLL